MGKFKNSLVTEIHGKDEYNRKQKMLKEKHGITNDNVVVVEKSNMAKFLIRVMGNIIRIIATICILILAIIGLMTLVYPVLRAPFFDIAKSILHQFFSLI